jgi:hypothetical protein
MTTEHATPVTDVDRALLGTLELAGSAVPYVDLEGEPHIASRLRVGDTEYAYERTFPVKGHGAVMPAAVAELQAAGKRILVAERGERYYLYIA